MNHADLNRALLLVEQDEKIAIAVRAPPHWATVGVPADRDFGAGLVGALGTSIDDLYVRGEGVAIAAAAANRAPDMTGLKRADAGAGKLAVRVVVIVHHHLEDVDLTAAVAHAAGLRVAVAEAVPFAAAVADQLACHERDPRPWRSRPALAVAGRDLGVVEAHRSQKHDELRTLEAAVHHPRVIGAVVITAREERPLRDVPDAVILAEIAGKCAAAIAALGEPQVVTGFRARVPIGHALPSARGGGGRLIDGQLLHVDGLQDEGHLFVERRERRAAGLVLLHAAVPAPGIGAVFVGAGGVAGFAIEAARPPAGRAHVFEGHRAAPRDRAGRERVRAERIAGAHCTAARLDAAGGAGLLPRRRAAAWRSAATRAFAAIISAIFPAR